MKMKTKSLVICALMAALTAVFSQIAVPIGPVPINLALLSIFVAGAFLGPVYGTLSQLVYVLLGAIGVPVFAHFSGGLSIVVGPTGGYIIGYIFTAFITGIIIKKSKKSILMYVIAMILGLVACYTLGTAWFMYVTKRTLMESLALCVLPFLIGDAVKIALAIVITKRLEKVIKI